MQVLIAVMIVNTDTTFHGDWNIDRLLHGLDAGGNYLGRQHQARPKAAILNTIARATHVQIDLVIAKIFTDSGACREIIRVVAAELDGDRVFGWVKSQEPFLVAMQDGTSRDHLGVQQRRRR
ncbi:MAG: hypothetical protein DHS20C11_19750 [Lysobacteraceae bacterium]|nr:MAG: hypothetical protein DHS20C11_19750 [Xanthomonadaceae bacterium]